MDEASGVFDDPQTIEAIERLSADQRRLVKACLDAIVHGPYIDHDGEFHSLMGVYRAEAEEVAGAWSEPSGSGLTVITVNNTLNSLILYPHNQWKRLSEEISGSADDVAEALRAFRGADRRDDSVKGHFDAMM